MLQSLFNICRLPLRARPRPRPRLHLRLYLRLYLRLHLRLHLRPRLLVGSAASISLEYYKLPLSRVIDAICRASCRASQLRDQNRRVVLFSVTALAHCRKLPSRDQRIVHNFERCFRSSPFISLALDPHL